MIGSILSGPSRVKQRRSRTGSIHHHSRPRRGARSRSLSRAHTFRRAPRAPAQCVSRGAAIHRLPAVRSPRAGVALVAFQRGTRVDGGRLRWRGECGPLGHATGFARGHALGARRLHLRVRDVANDGRPERPASDSRTTQPTTAIVTDLVLSTRTRPSKLATGGGVDIGGRGMLVYPNTLCGHDTEGGASWDESCWTFRG